MDSKTLFDEKLPKIFAEHPDHAEAIEGVFGFNISGDKGGQWTIDFGANPPAISTGLPEQANCTVEAADADFETVLEDPDQGMQLYFQGKIKIIGDPVLSTKLMELLKL